MTSTKQLLGLTLAGLRSGNYDKHIAVLDGAPTVTTKGK